MEAMCTNVDTHIFDWKKMGACMHVDLNVDVDVDVKASSSSSSLFTLMFFWCDA